MCEICHYTPCLSRCPCAPEPPALYQCNHCKEGISEGEEYVEIDGEHYHMECMEDMSTREILALVGIEKKIAERVFPW